MKKSLLTLLLSSCFVLLFAQKHTEVSFDLLSLSYHNSLELTLERQLNDRISMLFGVALDYDDSVRNKSGEVIDIVGADSIMITRSVYDYYDAARLGVFGEARYYFIPKKGMDRFYAGLGVFWKTLVSTEEGYPGDVNQNAVFLNIPAGYKIIINDKITIDLGFNYTTRIRTTTFNNRELTSVEANILLNGRVGYRF